MADLLPLAGQVAVVTGGTSGIGAAVVRQLAGLGCRAVSLARRPVEPALAHELAGSPAPPVFLEADLRQTATLAARVEGIAAQHGRIDLLVNNAGATVRSASILETQERDWDEAHLLNIKAPFLLLQACARQMIAGGRGGRIVNLSSSSAFKAPTSSVAYATAKAGIGQLSRAAAAEFGPHGINVNTVVPGLTRTGMTAARGDEGLRQAAAAGPLANLLQRLSEPEDVANLIVFLCLPQSRQITGQTLHVSAGAIV